MGFRDVLNRLARVHRRLARKHRWYAALTRPILRRINLPVDRPGLDLVAGIPRQLVPRLHSGEGSGRNVLLVRFSEIGDVLKVTPVTRALKAQNPETRIAVLTQYPALLANCPYVDEVIEGTKPAEDAADADLEAEALLDRILARAGRSNDFDDVRFLLYEARPGANYVQAYAEQCGLADIDENPEVFLTDDELGRAKRFLEAEGIDFDRPVVAFHTECGWPIRNWPQERFLEVMRHLEKHWGAQCLVLGKSPTSWPFDAGWNLIDRTDLRLTMGVLAHCDLMVCIDSGPMHLASALNVPIVAVFGGTSPDVILPPKDRAGAVQSELPCRGCHHHQGEPTEGPPPCRFDSVRCMESIPPDRVIERADGVLARCENKTVSIVIPVHGQWDCTRACLDSIFRTVYDVSFEIIVVDDRSPDHTLEALENWSGRVRVIANETNLGFGPTCNVGARAARGKYVLFLNNDIVATPGWLRALVDACESVPQAGVVGCKLLYAGTNYIQHAGVAYGDDLVGNHYYKFLPADLPAANRTRCLQAVTGACLLIERELFWELGGFDEQYRSSTEDNDLCCKVLQAGRKVVYCPDCVLHHFEGAVMGQAKPHEDHNRARFREKWGAFARPDLDEVVLLAEAEEWTGDTYLCLDEVPPDVRARLPDPKDLPPPIPHYRVQVAAGRCPRAGCYHAFLLADAPHADFAYRPGDPLPLPDGVVRELFLDDIQECLPGDHAERAAAEFHRVLTVEGRLSVTLSDESTRPERHALIRLFERAGLVHAPNGEADDTGVVQFIRVT